MQYRIVKLTRQLQELDKADANGDEEAKYRLFSMSFEEEQDESPRLQLLDKLVAELKEYGKYRFCPFPIVITLLEDEMLIRENTINGFPTPPKSHFDSVYNYVWDARPFDEDETKIYYQKDDFISLANGKEYTWLEDKVEQMLSRIPTFIARVS
jgi:hypothetical protein